MVSVVVDRQSVQHLRIGIEDQHAHVGERGQVQHVHEGFGMPFLRCSCISRLAVMPSTAQVVIGPGRGDQLQPDGRAVRDAEGDEQEQRRRGDVRQLGEEAMRLGVEVRAADLPAPAVEAGSWRGAARLQRRFLG